MILLESELRKLRISSSSRNLLGWRGLEELLEITVL